MGLFLRGLWMFGWCVATVPAVTVRRRIAAGFAHVFAFDDAATTATTSLFTTLATVVTESS